jgi:hypothetical protein
VISTKQTGEPRWRRQVLLAIGIVAGMAVIAIIRGNWGGSHQPLADPVRQAAWDKITPRLSTAEQSSLHASDKYTERVRSFFEERKLAARAFAGEVLSLSGKWAFVKSKLPWTDADGHERFLREAFDRLVFKAGDIQDLIESSVRGYLSELDGIESAMLVDIRADLSESDLSPPELLPALHSDTAFQAAYAQMVELVLPVVSRDLKVSAARELTSFIASDIAANIAVRILAAVTARLGLSAGILGTGAALTVETLGVGLVAAFLADMALDWAMHKAGYDPEGDIARKLCDSLDKVEALLLDGDPGSETLGLRAELKRLQQLRSRICSEALKKLILEGGL